MDRFFPPHTPEALAHFHLTENWPNWHLDHPTVDEALIARCAAYRAFDRYLGGADLFLPPRTRTELESILRRYSYDAIHNTIATSRTPLESGGYSRICHLAGVSIKNALDKGDNGKVLLALHGMPGKDSYFEQGGRLQRLIPTTI